MWASVGNAEAVLIAAARIQNVAPEKADIYLTLGRRMVDTGHAGPAVDVLIEHAKRAGLDEMLAELQPLSGRPTEDIKPLVSMLLEGAVATVAPPPPPPPPPPPEPLARPPEPVLPPPPPLPTWAAPPPPAPPGPPAVPEPVLPPPPPLPTWAAPAPPPPPEPPKPQFAPTPLPPPPLIETGPPIPQAQAPGGLDVGQVLPPTARESQVIEARSSRARVSGEGFDDFRAPPPRPSRGSRPAIPMETPRRGGGGVVVLLVLIIVGTTGWLMYSGRLPVPGPLEGVFARLRGAAGSGAAPAPPPVAAAPVAIDSVPEFLPPTGPVAPPIIIDGLSVENYRSLPGNTGGFRVLQRQNTGELITLIAHPVADTVGEPAAGEVRLDSLNRDTTTAVTNFQGFVVTLRGPVGPNLMRELIDRLISPPARP